MSNHINITDNDIFINNDTMLGNNTEIFLNGNKLDKVISISFTAEMDRPNKIQIEMYVDTIKIDSKAEVMINGQTAEGTKYTKFEIIDI